MEADWRSGFLVLETQATPLVSGMDLARREKRIHIISSYALAAAVFGHVVCVPAPAYSQGRGCDAGCCRRASRLELTPSHGADHAEKVLDAT